jgi:hypothetical protein
VDWLAPTSFTLPSVGTAGSIRKGSLIGPGSLTWDMGISKNLAVAGNRKVQIRAEFFNIFNRVNLNNPNANISAAAFGTISGASDPRIGQLALKILF